jgi:hypothetical protein
MFLIFFFAFLILFTKSSCAIEEFNITRNISYTIDQRGNAQVYQDVELTNNLSEIYPKIDLISLPFNNIENINGNDNSGSIINKIEKNNDSTNISLKFNEANLGKGKITRYRLNYAIPQLAIQKGNIWEIQLPEYKDIKNSETIIINLNVPETFGIVSFSSVTLQNSLVLDNQTHLKFELKNTSSQKLLFIFGNYQVFDFSFKYFLDNPSNKTIVKEIAVPPETDSQKIIFKEISPLPLEIKSDPDGNWLAQYEIKPQESFEINISGQAKIVSSSTLAELKDFSNWTTEQEYWPVNDSTIREISETLKQPHDIYNYVVNTLTYNYDSINSARRKGALNALYEPETSLCTEFTDLFVTLARAKNIPSREIEGFAYTNNSKIKPVNLNADVLHAWPQYYDQVSKSWISIDPTWAKTTNGIDYFNDLDLNHFIFVIHGINSTYPSPPGAYKNNQNIKTVLVSFANQETQPSFNPPTVSQNKSRFNQSPEITIYNPNPNTLNNVNVSFFNNQKTKSIGTINPYSSVKFKLDQNSFIDFLNIKNQTNSIKISYQNNPQVINFNITNLTYLINLLVLIALVILILSIGAIIISRKH